MLWSSADSSVQVIYHYHGEKVLSPHSDSCYQIGYVERNIEHLATLEPSRCVGHERYSIVVAGNSSRRRSLDRQAAAALVHSPQESGGEVV
jgi:hypothetical protein